MKHGQHNDDEDDILKKVQHCGLQLPSLPQEILLAIFRFTQPPGPPYQHEPSISRGPRNPWLDSVKTKKALVLVCKAWSAPATELLYSDVVLRRMGQISALANTFRADRKRNIANLVRAIRVDMCVVLTHCALVVREDFEYILGRCKMLLSFGYTPHPHPDFSFPGYDHACGSEVPTSPTAFNPTWILDLRHRRAGSLLAQSLNSRLSTLHLGLTTYEGSFRPLAHILSSALHLTSLKLEHFSHGLIAHPVDPSSPLPDLVFPVLKTLSIYYVGTQWTMPQLATLTCTDADHIPTSLLEAHGKQLKYLHFMYTNTPQDLEANTALLPHLYELCPRISHLVVLIIPEERTTLSIHSPTLRYLDIVGRPSVATYRAIAFAPTSRAPKLKKVRVVMDVYDFLPRFFHPAHMPGSDRALEDVSNIPGGPGHAWAVIPDELSIGLFLPGAVGDPRIPDEDETDSEGEYECRESLPSSPAPDSDVSGSDDEAEPGKDDDGGGREDTPSDGDSDSDMERPWFRIEDPPHASMDMFVDDLLGSSGEQYDRETILERFSRSQLGDFLLE
ncbi:hypothetical protein LXA43DRAFT_1184818 [Ganoderma leucocontextum]|nr:hypothetical protein LXA43DRAFT_1184818 [Ganoderma leucocontextum]